MTITKNGRAGAEEGRPSLGLMANGSSGGWHVEVDEATSGPDHWFLEIEGPLVYFSFEIPSPDIVVKALHFLSPRPSSGERRFDSSSDQLVIGKDRHAPVSLLRDDEFEDRFFLVISPTDGPIVRYSLTGSDLKSVIAALVQACEDLETD